MWTEYIFWLMEQPVETQVIVYSIMFIGLPLLCVILWFADKKWEEYKEIKKNKS